MNSIVQLSEELEKVDEKLKTTSVLLDKKVGCSSLQFVCHLAGFFVFKVSFIYNIPLAK